MASPMPEDAPDTSATDCWIFMGVLSMSVGYKTGAAVWESALVYDVHHIQIRADRRMPIASNAGLEEVFQRRLAQRIGKSAVVDGARQVKCADHRGHGDVCLL